jgi:hypothetical protein
VIVGSTTRAVLARVVRCIQHMNALRDMPKRAEALQTAWNALRLSLGLTQLLAAGD